jgi:hypothetical protein
MEIVGDLFGKIFSVSSDVLIIVVIAIALTAYGLMWGKQKIIALILSLYIGAFIFSFIPFNITGTLAQVAAFAAITGIMTFLIERMIIADFSFSKIRKFIEAGFLGIAGTMLLMLLSYHLIEIGSLYNFGSGIDILFSAKYLFWWLVAPLVILFFNSR